MKDGTKDWFSFRAPPNLARELREEAKHRGSTLTAVIVERLEGASGTTVSGQVAPEAPPEDAQVPGPDAAIDEVLAKQASQRADNTMRVANKMLGECTHPKDRRRQVTRGTICLNCRSIRRVNETEWRAPDR